jgi:hypothetical protein
MTNKEPIGGKNQDFPSDNAVPQNEPNTGEMK